MNNELNVLDASSLLAFIQEEVGAEIIAPILKHSVISTINLAEVLTALQRINIPPEEAIENISAFVGSIIPFDLLQAQIAAELYPQTKHKGLSLGDRACIALGIKLNAPIYTADKAWSSLNIPNAEIIMIR